MKINRKKVFWILGLLVLLLLLLAVGGAFLVDHVARGIIEKKLSAFAGREITVGRVSLGFIHPRVRVWNVAVHNPPGYPRPLMLTLPYLEADYDRAALKTNHLVISLLRIDADRVDLHETKEGKINLLDWPGISLPPEFLSSVPVANPAPPAPGETNPASQPPAAASDSPQPITLGSMSYDGIQMMQVNLRVCLFTSDLFPNRNMERVCNLHEQYPNVRTAQDFQAIAVVLGMKTGALFLLKDGKGADHYPLPPSRRAF